MSTVQKELRKIAGELSPADIEFCKEETQKIADLSPKMFAKVFHSCISLICLVLKKTEESE